METNIKVANIFSAVGRFGILFFGIAVFFFALIMGAQDNGGGIIGLVKNIPNTWP